jgi:hypothetical protein
VNEMALTTSWRFRDPGRRRIQEDIMANRLLDPGGPPP